MTSIFLPFPSLLRIIPATYAFWNVVKGGSDTTTKLMDDSIIRIPKLYLNPETVATSRLISLIFVLIHQLNQVQTSNQDPNIYPSLYHYCQAASCRSTFHVTLLKCKKVFEKEVKGLKQPPQPTNTPVQSTSINPDLRRNPSCCVNGVLLEQVKFAPNLPYITPKRKIIQNATKGENAPPPEVCNLIKNCTGMIMKSNPIQYQCCNLCSIQTAWYCPGCKR